MGRSARGSDCTASGAGRLGPRRTQSAGFAQPATVRKGGKRMLKLCARALALAALGIAALAPAPSQAASAYDHPSPNNWSSTYVLTPLEQKRLRTYGLKDEEIYLLANA